MQCFVPYCENTPKSVPKSQGITFHKLPTDGRTCEAWCQALGKQRSPMLRSVVVCSQHFLTEDFSKTRSGLKKLRRGAVPFVINNFGLSNINLKSKDESVNRDAANVEMKNEKPDESMLIADIGTLIKQEPLDQALDMETSDNVYDSHFDVCKEELLSNSSERDYIYNSEYYVNSTVTDKLGLKREISKFKELQELPEHEETQFLNKNMSASQNYYMMTNVKVEHLDSFTSLPADCARALGAPLRPDYTSTEDTSIDAAFSLKENSFDGQKKRKLIKAETGIQTETGRLVSRTPNMNLKLSYCKLCSFNSVSKANLKRHIRKHCSERISLTCEICGYKFTRRGNLQRHMKTHSGEKPFSCDICGYKFFWKFRLDFHMKSHTGEKSFSCYICQNKFTTKSNLMVHVKKHSGEKPFSCDICEKKYLTKGSLVVHMRNHTGEKPFSCNICEKKYISKCNVVVHMRNHTGQKPLS